MKAGGDVAGVKCQPVNSLRRRPRSDRMARGAAPEVGEFRHIVSSDWPKGLLRALLLAQNAATLNNLEVWPTQSNAFCNEVLGSSDIIR